MALSGTNLYSTEKQATGLSRLKICNLSKSFKKEQALADISLEIATGELFGIIGPDGAGKSSLLAIMAGVMKMDGGEVIIDTLPVQKKRKGIGYVPQDLALYNDLSIEENIDYQAGLLNLDKATYEKEKVELLNSMNLEKFKTRLADRLSGGMKQKLALCCALIGNPELVILDEPTTGLDPLARQEIWRTLKSLCEKNVTVVIATPFLEEANHCDRVGLLYKGRLEAKGQPQELKASLPLKRVEIATSPPADLDLLESILEEFPENENIKNVLRLGDKIEVLVRDPALLEKQLKDIEVQKSLSNPPEITLTEPTIENVFVTRLKALGQKELEHAEFTGSFGAKAKAKESGPAIEATALKKCYGSFEAVKELSLTVHRGEIIGLLGANGAGKTTSVKMMCGLIEPTEGEIIRFGKKNSTGIKRGERRKMGYMSQKFTLYNRLKVKENLEFYATIYEIEPDIRKERIKQIVSTLGLSPVLDAIVGDLPLGWKQRVSFGASIMHDPDLLFLDEPTAGVDPLARRHLWRLIRHFRKRGAAIIVTTHYLDEAEYCDSLVLIAAGTVVARGSATEIKNAATRSQGQPAISLEEAVVFSMQQKEYQR